MFENSIDTLQHRADSAKKKLLIGRVDATDGSLSGSTVVLFSQDGTVSTYALAADIPRTLMLIPINSILLA
jgi:hypothetical protein